MLLIECNQIKKYYGDRLILNIDNLKIYSDDRIGIVGFNGSGKTTLVNILCKYIEPDEGWVKLNTKAEYISQLEAPVYKNISKEMASKFGIGCNWDEKMSGGEKTRFKIAGALDNESYILLADEPTSNLDIEGIELLEDKLLEYKGALIVISHDRRLLDKLCNQIIEIEDGNIKIYYGNYSDYKQQKIKETERAQFEYEEFINEKERLYETIYKTKEKINRIKKAPKRMGNSEARLHKMGGQKAKSKLDKKVKNIEKRIEHMEIKEKPKNQQKIKIDILDSTKLYSKVIIEGKNINKRFGNRIIFKDAEFIIKNGSKTALIGPNGCGKSTLINMILNNENIKIAKGAKVGYFSQNMNILNKNLNIIDNVMESSIYPENFARLLLARLLFKEKAVYKKIDILSGGEQVKVSFAKILLQDINMLILDEPTNYLDINSMEAIEDALKEYDRTLLFVSHDRSFINSIANTIMSIENYQIKTFIGTYNEFIDKSNQTSNSKEDILLQIFLLENRLSEILGKLSMQLKKDVMDDLNKEYYEVTEKLRKLKQ